MKAEVAAIKSELSARRSVRRELQVKGKRKKVKWKSDAHCNGAAQEETRRRQPARNCYCTFRLASLRVFPAASVTVTVQSPARWSVLVAQVRQGLPPMRRSTGYSWSSIFQITFSVSPVPPSTRSHRYAFSPTANVVVSSVISRATTFLPSLASVTRFCANASAGTDSATIAKAARSFFIAVLLFPVVCRRRATPGGPKGRSCRSLHDDGE